ncbi:hypothetical protein [Allosphingosinicella sp.]|jgi:hypothetical protein|uniref:hypothetical protein n=1 Tax=Allosphingosinicella sp. TaxID=2823234 RepID=UPI002EE3ACA6
MEKAYWIGRKRASMASARGAASPEARLIHYEMAGRYSIKAAYASPPRVPQDPREALRLPAPGPGDRRDPDGDGQ